MQPEQTHPRPRGFRRRLLGDIFHGVKRYLILGVAATLCATFLTYVTPLVVSFTVEIHYDTERQNHAGKLFEGELKP